jgi:hypothetical protein
MMSPLELAAAAAKGFTVFECEACALNIRRALESAGHGGKLLEIRGQGKRDFMVCLTHDRGQTTITNNGRHLGVQVTGMVFDNLHPGGISMQDWLADFDAIGGVYLHASTDF